MVPRRTTEDVERILDLWVTGAPASAIAAQIGNGTTKNSVIGIVNRARERHDPRAAARRVRPEMAERTVSRKPRKIASNRVEPSRPKVVAPAVTVVDIPKMVEAIKVAPPHDPVDGHTVLTLGLLQCRWVFNQRNSAGLRLFCGKPIKDHRTPYCVEHFALVYVRSRYDEAR